MRARLRLSKLLPTTVILSGLLLSLATSAWGDQQDQRLNLAFAQLAKASSPQGVRVLESRIWKIWLEHPQPRINEMMRWGVEALNTQDYPTALKLFDSLVEAAPEFAEGWNKRATVRFLVGNYEGSIEDIRKTLALEPRHFGALSGLGMIHTNQERWFAAMAAFEQALRIHPYLIGVRHTINKLQQQLRKEST
jgi:tetratricopeptide (TPR) repeat protein